MAKLGAFAAPVRLFVHDSAYGLDVMRWPKAVVVHGIGVPIESWDELDELVMRYGDPALAVGQGRTGEATRLTGRHGADLSPADRALLHQFIEAGARGLLTTQISPAVGKRGKGIRPALDWWSRKIGLVTADGASAFVALKRADGRGFRLTDVHLLGARSILEQ